MITNDGKQIIAKYLLGQAPAFASYIAIGCGKKPLTTGDSLPAGMADYKNLDFEMFRVPVSSRGFVNDGIGDKIVLTAELPTDERYEISEVALYSAGSNPSVGSAGSKTIFPFTNTEGWQYNNGSSFETLTTKSTPLDSANDNVIADVLNSSSSTVSIFQTNADNAIFYQSNRASRYERCRFLNNIIMLRGNSSSITKPSSVFVIGSTPKYIQLTTAGVDFSNNSPTDKLKLAFSVINKTSTSTPPDTVRVLVKFEATAVGANAPEYANFEAELVNGSGLGQYAFSTNRYCVITKELKDLNISAGFTWNAVTTVKIYACALLGSSASANYYIGLDAMRLENVSTINPLYAMTGYSIIENSDATTIIKSPNTGSYVEFRFSVGVT